MIKSSVISFKTYLRSSYGEQTQTESARYGKCLEKLARYKNHVVFSARCKRQGIIPVSLRIRSPVNSERGKEIAEKASKRFLNERLRLANNRVRQLQDERKRRELRLRQTLKEEDYRKLNTMSVQHAEKLFERTKEKQQAKFDRWIKTQRTTNQHIQPKYRERWVANLSDHKLTEEEEALLRKGLNFAKTPREIPREEIISSVESSLRECSENPEKIEQVRASIARSIKNTIPPRPNTTPGERAALKSLKENKSITILPADKGNITVVVNTSSYEEKALEILSQPPFKRIDRDPTARNEKRVNDKLKQLLRNKCINKELAQQLKVSTTSTHPPLFYGSVKVHKENNPLRPIVSTIGSATYKISRFVSSVLRTYVKEADSYIVNTRDFLDNLREIQIKDDEIMVSFDIKSLFTNVPTKEATIVINDLLKKDQNLQEKSSLSADTINELLQLCLSVRNFQFRGEHFELTDGLAMGAPASPAIANIYMTSFEEKALDTWPKNKPKAWYRFVDDVFSIIKQSDVKDFLDHLNSQHPSIKFTLEMEKDKKLPFMDVMVQRIGEKLRTTVYRKPTHSGRYLNFNSNHPTEAKRSVVQALYNRLEYITTNDSDRQEEVARIEFELKQNDYPDEFIRKTQRARKQRSTENEDEKSGTRKIRATIPYIAGLSEDIRRILAQVGIRTAMTTNKMKWTLMNGAKDRISAEEKAGVVYAIGCKDCEKVYVGETVRTAKQRTKEHKMHARTGNTHLSAVAAHASTGHEIHWQPMILAKEGLTTKRKVLEALSIHRLNGKTINQDRGLQISKMWLDLVTPAGESSAKKSHL